MVPYHAAGGIVHHGKFWLPMSALGQERTFSGQAPTSALPLKADIGKGDRNVCFVPKVDI
jgi:hypothetical protein